MNKRVKDSLRYVPLFIFLLFALYTFALVYTVDGFRTYEYAVCPESGGECTNPYCPIDSIDCPKTLYAGEVYGEIPVFQDVEGGLLPPALLLIFYTAIVWLQENGYIEIT